jgi:hypothetical protein
LLVEVLECEPARVEAYTHKTCLKMLPTAQQVAWYLFGQ